MKKLLITLLVGLVLLPFSVKNVSAKIAEFDSARNAIEYTLDTDQQTGEYWNSFSLEQIAVNIGWMAGGGKPIKDPVTAEIIYTNGLVGDTSRAMAWMFSNPAATTERYVADVLNSAGFNIATPAYAQGLGFASLDPILSTWKTFRNMAYLLFVVVFMVIGFLIMMRQKVGGQTVVTAQQAIPQIIIALLVVTFSYAIAGLLIDMMYLVMYLLLALFGKTEAQFLDKNFLSLGVTMVASGGQAAFDAVTNFVESFASDLSELGRNVTSAVGGLTLAIVVAIAIALKVVELFFELLKTYITIILSIAFAPVILAMGALPGKNTFKQWITDLVGNLAAFPVVMLVLIVFDELTGNISKTEIPITTGGFQPPYLFGGGTAGSLPFILGVGMLMIMPEIVKEAKKALGVKEGLFSQFARDIGQSAKKGWEGGELIPGMAFTDTNRLPLGGLSGKNLVKKQVALGGGVIGGGYQAYQQAKDFKAPTSSYTAKELRRGRRDAALGGFKKGGAEGMARGAMLVEDKGVYSKIQKEINDEKEKNK